MGRRVRAVPERILGTHPWRNVALIIIALSLINMGLVAGWVVQRQTNIEQGKELAKLQGERQERVSEAAADKRRREAASNAARVGTCFTRARTGPESQEIVDGLLLIVTVQLRANRNAIKVQPDSDLTETRKMTIVDLAKARRALVAFSDRTRAATPALTSCKALAKRLGVDPKVVQEAGGEG